MITVKLTPYEHEVASTVGMRRFNYRRYSLDADWYDRNRMQDDLRANIAACVCEMGVAKALDKYWGAHAWHASEHRKYEHIADVGKRIEVRRIRDKANPVAIRWRDVERERVVVAAYAHPPLFIEVEVLGWVEAVHGWQIGQPAEYDKTNKTRVLAPGHWQDMKSFAE